MRQRPPHSPCHSEEHSDEESREQNTVRSHTGSFADAQDDSIFLRSIRAICELPELDSVCRLTLPPQRRLSGATKAPLCKGGCLPIGQTGGLPVPVTLGSEYNPSVAASPRHLPLRKGG